MILFVKIYMYEGGGGASCICLRGGGPHVYVCVPGFQNKPDQSRQTNRDLLRVDIVSATDTFGNIYRLENKYGILVVIVKINLVA